VKTRSGGRLAFLAIFLAALGSSGTGCAYVVAGATVVELSPADGKELAAGREVEIAVSDQEARELIEPTSWLLAERGYSSFVIRERPRKVTRPLLLLDCEYAPANEDEPITPGLAGRVALFMPGKGGTSYDRIFYLPYIAHPDDPEAQERHVRKALAEALEELPQARR